MPVAKLVMTGNWRYLQDASLRPNTLTVITSFTATTIQILKTKQRYHNLY